MKIDAANGHKGRMEIRMEKEKCSYEENVGGVSYVVIVRASTEAKFVYEELIKKLITEEVMQLRSENETLVVQK